MQKPAPKAKADRERESILRRALLLPDCPTFGPFTLRPFSLWTLDLCEEVGLDFFLKLPPGTRPAGTRLFQLAALVWFHDSRHPESDVDRHLMAGTWHREVNAFLRRGELEGQLKPLEDYLAFFAAMIAAASVRVKKKPKTAGEKEEPEPRNLLEPGNTFALIWSITGGQLASADQERFLYRGLPLPRLLSYYHCALRAALLWTVARRRGRRDGKTARRAKAAVAAVVAKDKSAVPDFF